MQALDDPAERDRPSFPALLQSAVSQSEVLVGLVPPEELAAEEQRIADARRRADEAEAQLYARRDAAVARREDEALRRVAKTQAAAESRLRRRKQLVADTAVARETGIHRVFRRAEAHLKATLKHQQGVVQERYGDFEEGRAGARRWKVEWTRMPQPVAIHIRHVRAVKDKVCRGRVF